MNKPILKDQKARDIITTVFNKNFLVEAGAGSGKTTYLVRRMVEAIRLGMFKIEEIVAITFTKKAASELKERFQTKLEQAFEKSNNLDEQRNLEVALQNIDQCFIGTVHSFCSRLLRERPIEAGIDPDFKELDDLNNALLRQQAWEEYIGKLKDRDDIVLANLDRIGLSPIDLYESFNDLSNYPDVDIVSIKKSKPDFTKEIKEVFDFIEKARHSIPDTPVDDKGYDDLQNTILQGIKLRRILNLNNITHVIKILSLFDKKLKVVQKRWTSKEEAKDFNEEALVLREQVIEPKLKEWREYCHFYILEFIRPAIKYYDEYRKKLSYLNFQDLLMNTALLLKNNPEVRKYFQYKYKCLLIDEFQDTDPIQAEIMFYLTGSDINEGNWQKLLPTPGSLFVVGDPKQSIYRFRRADIDIYNLVKDLINQSGGEILKLTSNFRSLNSLGDYLNPIFKNILPTTKNKYQAEYAPMETVHANDMTFGVRNFVIPSEYTKQDDIVIKDAEYIAKIIKNAVSNNGNIKLLRNKDEIESGMTEQPMYKDFMILLRYKKSMEVYARKLEEYGIPVRLTGGGNIGEAKEIKELLKLLKLLTNSDNQVLLVAVLRGLFFGVSDNALYNFKFSGGKYNIFAEMPDKLELNDKKIFENAFGKLKEYYMWSRKYSPSIVLEKIILDLGLVQFASLQEMDKSRCGGIYYLLERVSIAECDGTTDFSVMVKQLETILEVELEEELDIFCEENTVRIMNLHKAKGLEAPVVFLANPAKARDVSASYHVERANNVPKGHFTVTKKTKEFESILIGIPDEWDKHKEQEDNYLRAEEIRLVYVAATRAKNLLIISDNNKRNKNPWALLLEQIGIGNEIDIPEVDSGRPDEQMDKVIRLEEFYQMKQVCKEWSSSLKLKNYDTASPTDFKDISKFWSIDRGKGGGVSWGNAVHKTLEYLVKGNEDIEFIVEEALIQNNLMIDRKTELISLVNKFKQSSLWKRIQFSKVKFTEVPFSIKVDKHHRIYNEIRKEDEIPIILTGTIDLIFKEDDKWVVVDYKTDNLKNVEDYKELEEVYKKQVKIYSAILEELTGEKVKSEEIVFLH